MKTKIRILIVVILLFFCSLAYFYLINMLTPNLPTNLEILFYVFMLLLIIGPFLPRNKNSQSFFGNIIDKFTNINDRSKSNKFQEKIRIDLNANYEKPLITKCKCGMILTSYTRNCPDCGRENPLYQDEISKPKPKL
jgi:hypothetical protein